jgi:hypothetical protein
MKRRPKRLASWLLAAEEEGAEKRERHPNPTDSINFEPGDFHVGEDAL